MGGYLDDDLSARLREVLAGRHPLPEPELWQLAEQADAYVRVLRGDLGSRERRLEALTADPEASVAEIAEELRVARELRAHVDELRPLLARLDERARELTTGRLLDATAGRPPG